MRGPEQTKKKQKIDVRFVLILGLKIALCQQKRWHFCINFSGSTNEKKETEDLFFHSA